MKLVFKLPLSIAVAGATFTGISVAQDWYVSGSISWNNQSSSDTEIRVDDGLGGTTGSSMKAHYDDGLGVSAEIGRKFDNVIPGLRGALEVSYTKAEVDNFEVPDIVNGGTVTTLGGGDIENIAVFANAYYDFDLSTNVPVKPYVGAGIGVAMTEVSYNSTAGGITTTFFDDDDVRFAYQGKAGVSYAFNDRTDLYAEYTYRASDDLTFGNLTDGEYTVENKSHLVGLGLRMRF